MLVCLYACMLRRAILFHRINKYPPARKITGNVCPPGSIKNVKMMENYLHCITYLACGKSFCLGFFFFLCLSRHFQQFTTFFQQLFRHSRKFFFTFIHFLCIFCPLLRSGCRNCLEFTLVLKNVPKKVSTSTWKKNSCPKILPTAE